MTFDASCFKISNISVIFRACRVLFTPFIFKYINSTCKHTNVDDLISIPVPFPLNHNFSIKYCFINFSYTINAIFIDRLIFTFMAREKRSEDSSVDLERWHNCRRLWFGGRSAEESWKNPAKTRWRKWKWPKQYLHQFITSKWPFHWKRNLARLPVGNRTTTKIFNLISVDDGWLVG